MTPVLLTSVDDVTDELELAEHQEALSIFTPHGGGLGQVGHDLRRAPVVEVAQLWGPTVMSLQHFDTAGRSVQVGAGGDFVIADDELPTDGTRAAGRSGMLAYPLVRFEGGEAVLALPKGWTGFIETATGRLSLEELQVEGLARPLVGGGLGLPVRADTVVVADSGTVQFMARLVPAGARVAGKADRPDYPFLGLMGLMGVIFAAVALVVLTSPPPAENVVVEVPDRFANVMLHQPEVPKIKSENKAAATNKESGEKAKGKEGKVGKEKSKMKVAKGSKVAMDKQKLDRQIAENAGILGVAGDVGALEGIFDASLHAGLTEGIGGLYGAKGNQQGSGGLSSRGGGFGGGGRVHGLGGTGTLGRGGGDGTYGESGGSLGDKKPDGEALPDGPLTAVGGMDSGVIDRIIKNNMNRFRYCYQRELNRDPSLAGKVSVYFVIAGDGSVSKAKIKRSTLNSAAAEGCMVDRFYKLQFPEVKGGGTVLVTYPFMFSGG